MPRCRRKHGFTLVEVIVAFGLLALIIGITAPLIMSAMSSFARGQRLMQAKQLGLGAYEVVESRVSLSSQVSLESISPGRGVSAFTISDGLIMLDGQAVYSREMCGSLDFSLKVKALEATLLEVTIEILHEGSVIFTKTGAFRLINMEKHAEEIAGAHRDSTAVYFTILPTGG